MNGRRKVTPKQPHPALSHVLSSEEGSPSTDGPEERLSDVQTTSASLARALTVGLLSGLDQKLTELNVWDPAAGSGYAGAMLAEALTSAGVHVRYRGQEISDHAVRSARERFAGFADAEIVRVDTLAEDPFAGFAADLVVLDPPWGMGWANVAQVVEGRRRVGDFPFGLPQKIDSTWLFVSLALEKLRSAAEGGGRVAALVPPGALRFGGATAEMRRAILEAGLLESVTRLPEGLAPNTAIPLYLLTFTNRPKAVARGTAMIADLQTQFARNGALREMPLSAFMELESGLRTGKSGPRNRTVKLRQFTRRDVSLARETKAERKLSWRLTTYNDTPVDPELLESRYGPDSGVVLDGESRETVDLDPSEIFADRTQDILKDLKAKGWSSTRLSRLLAVEPESSTNAGRGTEGDLYVSTAHAGQVSTEQPETEAGGRTLTIRLDSDQVHPSFLAAWLNSEQGVASRTAAIAASSSGSHPHALRSDPTSLMRWADELIIPVPASIAQQVKLATADEQLGSFEADLRTRRASIWSSPESAETVVSRLAGAFDDSISSWLDHLPYPIATAFWTAETASSQADRQLGYVHAWEAVVAFHASVLLSAIRSMPGNGSEVQSAIRRTLSEQNLGIERASFGTWIVILEKTSSDLRRALQSGDADEISRVRRAFGDLGQAAVERLVSKDVIKKFNEVNSKRNRWLGHSGYTSGEERQARIDSLVSDVRELRHLLGDVWTQLVLVRAGVVDRGRGGYTQTVEVALGVKSPFRKSVFAVGDPMISGDLYLARDGSQSPLPLLRFVQLKAAPRDAQYTTYFYNRIEGANVRLVSYQHGSESELHAEAASLRDDFGELTGT